MVLPRIQIGGIHVLEAIQGSKEERERGRERFEIITYNNLDSKSIHTIVWDDSVEPPMFARAGALGWISRKVVINGAYFNKRLPYSPSLWCTHAKDYRVKQNVVPRCHFKSAWTRALCCSLIFKLQVMIQKRYQYNITALDRICTRWVTVRTTSFTRVAKLSPNEWHDGDKFNFLTKKCEWQSISFSCDMNDYAGANYTYV